MSWFATVRDDWPSAPPKTPVATRNRRSSNSSGIWTDEKFELAKKLWQDGLSAKNVAKELGSDFTRNAVIAKLHRAGASARPQSLRPASNSRPPRKAAARPELRPPQRKPPQPFSFKGGPPMMPVPLPAVPEIIFCPTAEHVTIHELTEHTCRFPVSDDPRVPVDEFMYCGALPIGIGESYCPFHFQLSYTGVPPRKAVHARPRG